MGFDQKLRLGVGSYVRDNEWEAAKVYPAPSARLTLTDAQREALKLFGPLRTARCAAPHTSRSGSCG